jgi:shikimate kinase
LKNIVLIGMPGCGKTSMGRRLHKRLRRPLLDTDVMIVQREKRSIPAIFEESGEAYFRQVEHACVKEAAAGEGQIIATGGGVVLNPENMAALKQTGIIFFLDVTPGSIEKRTKLHDRPLVGQDSGKLRRLYDERIDLYRQYADVRLDNRGLAKKTMLRILNEIKRRGGD